MKHDPVRSGKRRPLNLSIDSGIVDRARDLDLNLSQLGEEALRLAIKKEEERRWIDENRGWITAHQKWVEENPLPLERYRLF